jgi:hypothetical protein
MDEQSRIAELEAKLKALQTAENNGKDPELLAKAKDRARMSWMDIQFVLEHLIEGEHLDKDTFLGDIENLKEALVERKYAQLSGANKSSLGW